MTEKRVALVTGASSGIGLAIARALHYAGYLTFGTTRGAGRAAELPPGVELLRLDVRDEQSVRSCVGAILDQAGRIDALVNSAGYALLGSVEETGVEEARDLFETNFFGVHQMTRAVLPVMRKQRFGRIANISSVLGFLPAPYMGLYAASKHALEGYSETLDHEVRRFGIRVLLIEPGFMRTRLGDHGQFTVDQLDAYSSERERALAAIDADIANGESPVTVASAVLEALASRSPRLRYTAGRDARSLRLLRRFAPTRLLDDGLRKRFRLEAVER